MKDFEKVKDLILNHFSLITLSIGLLLIISNTIDISVYRNPKDPNDKLNTHFGLNVAGLVFIGLFVSNDYIFPHLVKKH
jgi:cell division protein FtsW (lipid II flippase)